MRDLPETCHSYYAVSAKETRLCRLFIAQPIWHWVQIWNFIDFLDFTALSQDWLPLTNHKGTITERELADFQHHFDNSQGSGREPYSCILTNFLRISRQNLMFSSSRRLQLVVATNLWIFIAREKVARNHQSLFCLDWTHSSRCPAHSKSQYWKGPNSSGGAGMRCRILWLRKERVEWAPVWCDHLNPLFNHRLCEDGETLVEG